VLGHATYFAETNKNVLENPRVTVYVNDGRQHLRMQPEAVYDVIALEPPPITHAGVGSLYSKDFYALARTRLKPTGYLSQWLPAYQVPPDAALALVRAFVDVFPNAVLLSGADAELLLVGTNDQSMTIDPVKVNAALSREPDVAADLRRIDLGSARELVGTFIGAARTLADATRASAPTTDDWPLQEYTARSLLSSVRYPVPASLFDLGQISAWCPTCFDGGKPVQAVEGLDRYMALLDSAYKRAAPSDEQDAVMSDQFSRQIIQNSTYLESVLIGVHYRLGVGFLAEGRFTEAVAEFREEARLSPSSPRTHRNLGRALAATGATKEAIAELRLAAGLDPSDMRTVADLGDVLLAVKQYAAAAETLRAVSRLSPASAEVHNKIGIALAADGKFDEAIPEFQRALTLQPDFPDAQRRLSAALEARRRPGAGAPWDPGDPGDDDEAHASGNRCSRHPGGSLPSEHTAHRHHSRLVSGTRPAARGPADGHREPEREIRRDGDVCRSPWRHSFSDHPGGVCP
jgi:Flp pilus assembly protein TadD